ncbi:MAG: hypothetical protein IPH20_25045 [Bacteroidales bacterium]|nr:hypothetical protein [Bacteroidales bacterium]
MKIATSKTATAQATDAVTRGATALGLNAKPSAAPSEIAAMLKGIDVAKTAPISNSSRSYIRFVSGLKA